METSLGFASVPFPTLSRAPPSTLGPLCFIQAYFRDTAVQFQITAIKQDVSTLFAGGGSWLQFVKNTTSEKCNKMRYACIREHSASKSTQSN